MIDLTKEFVLADSAASKTAYDWLISHGVARDLLYVGPARFGVAEIVPCNDGTYQPIEHGQRAIVMPALPLAAPWDEDFPSNDVGDLIAWRADDPVRWWCRTAMLPVMNPFAIEAARYEGALRVFSSPLAWLRAAGDGIVVLDRCANLRLWLGGVPEIVADTVELGREIARRLREPVAEIPRILVPRQAA